MKRSKGKIWMGIDPGKTTGVAVWQARSGTERGKFLRLCSSKLLLVMDLVREFRDLAQQKGVEFEAVIEEPGKIGGIYARHKQATKGEDQSVLLRIAVNVGQNIEHAKLLIEMCEAEGVQHSARPPVKAKKWNAADFKTITGEPKGHNQHIRDAARLVFGL